MTKHIMAAALCAVSLWGCRSRVTGGPAIELGEFHTQVNMWVEHPKPILTTNYHMGTMIPTGAPVTLIAGNAKDIRFRWNGGEHVLRLDARNTRVSMGTVQTRLFKKSNPLESAAFTTLTEAQQAAVRNGQVVEGMTKEAVLMAYGYPPERETPSTEVDRWIYWRSRFMPRKSVTFEDGKVSATVGF